MKSSKPSKDSKHTSKNNSNDNAPNIFRKEKNNFFGGNQESFFKPSIQAKLNIGEPNDKYEVEADSVADEVVNKTSNPTTVQPKLEEDTVQQKSIAENITPVTQLSPLQRMAEEEQVQAKEEEELQMMQEKEVQMKEEEEVQAKEDDEEDVQMMQEEDSDVQMMEDEDIQEKEDEEDIQTKANTPSPTTDNTVSTTLKDSRGKGSPIPDGVRSEMETGFGADFSGVRIHTDSKAVDMNQKLGAKAFTNKNNIYFNQDNFNPATKEGKTLLAHELTHTVQQGAAQPAKKEAEEKDTTTAKATPATQETTAPAASTPAPTAVPSQSATTAPAPQQETAPASEEAVGAAPAFERTMLPEQEAPVNIELTPAPAVAPTTPRSPQEDPNFTGMEQRVNQRAKTQKKHESSNKASSKAQAAAVSPSNERASTAQAKQVGVMEQQEPGAFNEAAFKQQLMQRINRMQLPKDEDEADKFDKNNNINQVRNAAKGDVTKEKAAASGAIENTTAQKPNVAAVPKRKVTPLVPTSVGKKPAAVGAQNAMPPARGESEVSQPLQHNMGQLDQQMASNQITDDQLAKSNEPSFTTALDAKNKADTHTKSAPQAFRAEEQGVLQGAQANAKSKSAQKLGGMHQQRAGLLQQVTGKQQQTGTKDTGERARIANKINSIYQSTKTDVESTLSTLDTSVTSLFDNGVAVAKRAFERHIRVEMDAYKERRYGGFSGFLKRVKDTFVGLPDEVNRFFVQGRNIFIKKMDSVISQIAALVARQLTKAKNRITQGKQEVQEYVTSLPKELRAIGKEAAKDIQYKFSQLEQNVDSKQDELIDSLATKYNDSLKAVDAHIDKMKAANKGLVGMAINAMGGVIRTIIQIKNMLTNLLNSALEVIGAIVKDPIGFLSLLIQGVGQGLRDFMANIGQNIQAGLIGWLTGSLGSAGITIPENLFSLSGIFSLVAQVLNVTWTGIRQRAVKVLGEPVVKVAETSVEIFQIIKQDGAGGLWKYVKDQFTNLKEMVMDAIKDLIQTQVVQAGIKWILSLLTPAGAFVKAAMAIIDIVKFFIERGSQVLEMVQGFINAVKAVASGSVGAVAAAIQNALKRALPVMIGFLASLLGISGLTQKVTKIIRKVQTKIDNAIMAVIMRVKKLVGKLFGKKGKRTKPKDKKEHDKEVKKGMQYLHKQEKKLDKNSNSALTKEEAEKVAAKTKSKFKVFTAITPKKEGKKWVYHWKGSSGQERGLQVETELPKYKLPAFNTSKAKSFDAIITSKTPKGEDSKKQTGVWPAWDAVRGDKADGLYVRMHLLHDDLGGKATISNLTPTKSGLNSRFFHAVEKHATEDKKTSPIWYRVKISYHSEAGFTDYISKINASYGMYEKKNGTWQYGKTKHKFVEANPKPVFGERVYNLNADGAQNLSASGLDFNFANLIVRERKENDSYKNFGDFEDRMEDRNDSGRIKLTNFRAQMKIIKNLNRKKLIIT